MKSPQTIGNYGALHVSRPQPTGCQQIESSFCRSNLPSFSAHSSLEERNLPAKVIPMPSGVIPTEREVKAEPSREEVRHEDRRLAIAAQKGCLQSFESLVNRFEKPLYKFLNEKTKNHHLTEDLLQNTFITAYRKLERYNPDYDFVTWVFTIANRLAITNYRKLKPQAEEVDFVIYETPLCTLIKTEHQKTIWGQAKQLLSKNHFTCLRLFYEEGMKVIEIAEAMDVSEGSVKVWLHRARKRLAAHLKPT